MTDSLQGKTALVTGGSTGIGLAAAQELAARGAHVIITGRREAELAHAVRTVGHGAVGIVADSSKLADLDRVYAQIDKLDILLANAGGGDFATLDAITEEHFDRTFATNVKGTVFTVQKALPHLRDGASIILTGSTAGVKGTASFSVYSATKAAIRNFARSWLIELAPRKIRVNVVSPGPIETPGLAGLVPPEHKSTLFGQLAGIVPLGRLGSPAEVAKAIAFLASDDASFVTGAELFVDGGAAQI